MLRVPTRHGTSTRRKWACLLAALAFLLVRVPGILDGGSEAAGGGFDDDAEDGVPFLRGPRCTPDGTCLRTAFIQGHNARRLLTQGLAGSVPWQLVQRPEDATLFWMRNRDKRAEAVAAGDGGRVFNKIPARWQVADKALLAANVHAFLRSNGLSDSPLPETVPLVTVADMNTLSKKAAAMPGIWIVKMTSESMGRGIEIVTDMAAWVRSPTFSNVAAEVLKGERFVCQKYVTNPLLLNGRKSECRLYWLLASVNPMIVAVFHEGQVRLNSMPYQNHSFDNPMIHLTNVHQQRDHPEFEQMLKEGKLKWSMTRWKEYLVAEMKVKPEVADGLLVRMKWSLVRVVNATTDLLRLDTHSKDAVHGRFELFGSDFILDEQLNVRLTEVQQGPGLSHSDPVKAKVLGQALTGATDYVYNLMTARLQGRPLGEVALPEGYQFLVNEATQPAYYFGS